MLTEELVEMLQACDPKAHVFIMNDEGEAELLQTVRDYKGQVQLGS
jgi:hypothetical protein